MKYSKNFLTLLEKQEKVIVKFEKYDKVKIVRKIIKDINKWKKVKDKYNTYKYR